MQEVKIYEEVYNRLDGNVIVGGNPVQLYTYIPSVDVPDLYIRLMGYLDSPDNNKCNIGEQKLFMIEVATEDTNKLNYYDAIQQVKKLIFDNPSDVLPTESGFQNVWMNFESSSETQDLRNDSINVFVCTLTYRYAVKELS